MASLEGRILVTGAVGQIGSELTMALRERWGANEVVAAGHIKEPMAPLREGGPFKTLDVRDGPALRRVVERYDIEVVYHMASVLSASGEEHPMLVWDVNVNGLLNVLEVARQAGLHRIFVPSSMAVYGPSVSRDLAPQDAPLYPMTIYGIGKVAGEAMGSLYWDRFGLDVRGLRYPSIISHRTPPSGRTTDYAVEVFHAAETSGHYQSYVREDTVLPMMYMDDCLRATIDFMDAPRELLTVPTRYNVSGLSFAMGELVAEIQRHLPGFSCSYVPDGRQAIADRWPQRMDDRAAQSDWGWSPSFDLAEFVERMLFAVGGAADSHGPRDVVEPIAGSSKQPEEELAMVRQGLMAP